MYPQQQGNNQYPPGYRPPPQQQAAYAQQPQAVNYAPQQQQSQMGFSQAQQQQMYQQQQQQQFAYEQQRQQQALAAQQQQQLQQQMTSQAPPAPQPTHPGAPPSQATADKVLVAKDYMRKYYEKVRTDDRAFILEHSRARPKKLNIDEYELLNLIGRGAFGEVRLAYKKDDASKTIVALKTLRKDVMIAKKQVQHVRSERELLVEARSHGSFYNQWLVDLYCTFQDEKNLYFVMEFAQGGDMMTWLIKYDTFSNDVAKFYTAQLVCAVESLHQLNYAHRDIKPDNILVDVHGHIKLTDFGLSKQAVNPNSVPEGGSDEEATPGQQPTQSHSSDASRKAEWHKLRQNREIMYSTVGSPGYIAPEILMRRGYGMEVDWWSVGIILYEMLCGYPPFYADNNAQSEQKVVRWKQYLEFPSGKDAISREATDLIKGLLCDAKDRLPVDRIKSHPFFHGVDWENLRAGKAPFNVDVTSPTDTKYFDKIPELTQQQKAAQDAKAAEAASRLAAENAHDQKYMFYGFSSKFNGQGQATNARTAGGTLKRGARGAIPDFNDDDEDDE